MGSKTVDTCDLYRADLPSMLFAPNHYPDKVRINAYSKPNYLLDILEVLEGTTELDQLLASPLGSLFSLPISQSALSGQLVHQMLCRQLFTAKQEEMWFVFGGQPLRFSLMEFAQVTGLNCGPDPPAKEVKAVTTYADGASPYWYELIGGKLGRTTVESLVNRLKHEKDMEHWRKFRLSLLVLVEGILMCSSSRPKPSVENVEMVKNVEFFLNFPWGRHSFKQTLSMIKVGARVKDRTALISKLKQETVAVHGFPLAIQLHALRSVPLLLQYLPNGADQSTFLHRTIKRVAKVKSYHADNILEVEYDPQLQVLSPQPHDPAFLMPDVEDPKVTCLENLISEGYVFEKNTWRPGSASLPSVFMCRKRHNANNIVPEASTSQANKRRKPSKANGNGKDSKGSNMRCSDDHVGSVVEEKLKRFKDSIIGEIRDILLQGRTTPQSVKMQRSSHISSEQPVTPTRNTRSGCAGLHGISVGERSSGLKGNDNNTTKKRFVPPLSSEKAAVEDQVFTSDNCPSVFQLSSNGVQPSSPPAHNSSTCQNGLGTNTDGSTPTPHSVTDAPQIDPQCPNQVNLEFTLVGTHVFNEDMCGAGFKMSSNGVQSSSPTAHNSFKSQSPNVVKHANLKPMSSPISSASHQAACTPKQT